MIISKNKIKFIHSLELKKNRKESNLFVAEGNKLVSEALSSMHCDTLVATSEWFEQHPLAHAPEMLEADKEMMNKVSFLKTPQEVLGLFEMPSHTLSAGSLKSRLSLVLDTIQDPGNLGTIIRLADWFGIEDIICSPETADCYAPKTVQATMGAIARIRVHYTPLIPFLEQMKGVPVYGTYLEGDNIYQQNLSPNGLIVMGHEGRGIAPELDPFMTKKLHIPSYPHNRETSESLNVAIATSIICSEFRRRM